MYLPAIRAIIWALTAWPIYSLIIGPVDEIFTSISNGLFFLLFWVISSVFWTGLAVIVASLNRWVQGGIRRGEMLRTLQANTRGITKR